MAVIVSPLAPHSGCFGPTAERSCDASAHVVPPSNGLTTDQWAPASVVTARAAGLAFPCVSGSTGGPPPVPIVPDGRTAGVYTIAPSLVATMWLSAAG